jgi:hypothetical protein
LMDAIVASADFTSGSITTVRVPGGKGKGR